MEILKAKATYPGTFYRDNAAMIDIAFTTWSNTDAESIRLYGTCKECRYIVINDSTKQIVFDRSYNGFVNHLVIGFRKPGMYKLNVQVKDGRGYVNSYCQMLDIRGLQANFNMGVIDGVRCPQLVHGKESLHATSLAIKNRTKKLNIAGMSNATLYRTTREVMSQTSPTLYVPAMDNNNFAITDYDATKPGDYKTTYMYKNLVNAESELLRLNRLQDIRLIDSNTMTLPQYSGTFLELQFDIVSDEDVKATPAGMVADGSGKFELTLESYKHGPSATIAFNYDNAQDLLNKLLAHIQTLQQSQSLQQSLSLQQTQTANFAHLGFFNDFTWTIRETYVNVVLDENDAINPEVGGTVWCLYAMSKHPMSYQQYKFSGASVATMLYDNVEFCDNVPSMCIVQLDDSDPAQIGSCSIQCGNYKKDFNDVALTNASGEKDLTNLYDLIRGTTSLSDLVQVQKLQVKSNSLSGDYETDPLTKFAIYGKYDLTVQVEHTQFPIQYDTPRNSYDTYFEQIDHGTNVTVGCLLVCVPDENVFAFAPYDLKWTVTYIDNVGNKQNVATSIKWLLKYHCRKIGNYTITLQIIDPMTSNIVQVINKSIVVSKAQ